jgi:hypothetical protein
MEVAFSELILHDGKVPPHLLYYMKKLSKAILSYIHEIYGPEEIVRRVADPFWFQAFNNVIGMDWDSSGATTVVIYMLKSFASPSNFKDLGLAVLGGKGADSRAVIEELNALKDSNIDLSVLEKVSRLGAKIDGVALQDGYNLYIHSVVVDQSGSWTIIQQGMNTLHKLARRYHLHNKGEIKIVGDPHSGIACNRVGIALNLVDEQAANCRRTILDIVASSSVSSIVKDIAEVNRILRGDRSLESWMKKVGDNHSITNTVQNNKRNMEVRFSSVYRPVTDLNRIEAILRKIQEIGPETFEELLIIKGVGPETIRALTLVSAIIYGIPPSFKDPVTHPIDPFLFAYAHGGKDGVPYPVNIEVMKRTIEFLEEALREAKLEDKVRRKALERLHKMFTRIVSEQVNK